MNLCGFMKTADTLFEYLKRRDFSFNERGFPVFEEQMFLKEWPDIVVPYDYRKNKIVSDPAGTVLCLYSPDKRIYPRIEKVVEEITEYKKYMGVIGSDITVTDDMDLEWQNSIQLVNQLYTAVLAVNGIKIIMNLRSGGVKTFDNFAGVPHNVFCACSFLGCTSKTSMTDMGLPCKILQAMPDKLLIYGKQITSANIKLDNIGVNYRYYPDFHTICRLKNYRQQNLG